MLAIGCGTQEKSKRKFATKEVEPKRKQASKSEADQTKSGENASTKTNFAIQQTAVGRIRPLINKFNSHLIVSVDVRPNCKGFNYTLDVKSPPSDCELSTSNGIPFAIPRKYVPFFQGVSLRHGSKTPGGPEGFIFENPDENIMLLPEYQEMERQQKADWKNWEELSKTIDLAEMLLKIKNDSDPDALFKLRVYQLFRGASANEEPPEFSKMEHFSLSNEKAITHVVEVPLKGQEPLLAVFTNGEDSECLGGCALYRGDASEVNFHMHSNYFEPGDVFKDINNDGEWEYSQTNYSGRTQEIDGKSEKISYRHFFVAPIREKSSPMFSIAFQIGPNYLRDEFECVFEESGKNQYDIVLKNDEKSEIARYKWSPDKNKYVGPKSGKSFFSKSGALTDSDFETFIKSQK